MGCIVPGKKKESKKQKVHIEVPAFQGSPMLWKPPEIRYTYYFGVFHRSVGRMRRVGAAPSSRIWFGLTAPSRVVGRGEGGFRAPRLGSGLTWLGHRPHLLKIYALIGFISPSRPFLWECPAILCLCFPGGVARVRAPPIYHTHLPVLNGNSLGSNRGPPTRFLWSLYAFLWTPLCVTHSPWIH